MQRTVTLVAILASSCALAAGALAGEFRDSKGRFALTVPDGWETEVPANTDTITIVLGTGKSDTNAGAACLGMFIEIPSTRSASQAELNTAVEGQLTKEFWTSALKSSGDQNFDVKSTGNRDKDGRRIHNVVFAGSSLKDGKTHQGTGKMEVHFVPGSMHSMMCVTDTASFPTFSSAFEKVFSSYEPGRAAVIASVTTASPSALTLFARTSYQGQAQVLSSDTPDMTGAGWIARAGSLSVDGVEPWQVCEGRNYSGTCHTVMSGMEDGGLVVMSARRSTATFRAEVAAATLLRRGVEKFHARRNSY